VILRRGLELGRYIWPEVLLSQTAMWLEVIVAARRYPASCDKCCEFDERSDRSPKTANLSHRIPDMMEKMS